MATLSPGLESGPDAASKPAQPTLVFALLILFFWLTGLVATLAYARHYDPRPFNKAHSGLTGPVNPRPASPAVDPVPPQPSARPVPGKITQPKPPVDQEPLPTDSGSSSPENGITPVNPDPGPGTSTPTPVDAPPPVLAGILPATMPIRHVEPSRGLIALTFDDGPYPRWTTAYLEVLKSYGVSATFFMVGNRMETWPHLAAAATAAGQEVGNHSQTHKGDFSLLTPGKLEQEIASSQEAAMAATGLIPRFFRPPGGNFSPALMQAANEHGLVVINWDNDPRDWDKKTATAPEITARVIRNARAGGIILLHEGQEATLEALPWIIEGLRAKGLEPVSIGRLLENTAPRIARGMAPGVRLHDQIQKI